VSPLAKRPEFEAYLLTILEGLQLDPDERGELLQEWNQHLHDLFEMYLDQGLSEQEAVKLALRQFGNADELHAEVKKSYPSPKHMMYLKELMIWVLCLIAASVGPWLFIHARYSVSFIIFPLLALVACTLVYHVLITRIARQPRWIIPGTLLVYAVFLGLAVRLTSFEFVWNQFTSLTAGGDGLFTMSIIHLTWVAIVASQLITRSTTSAWVSAVRSSFRFWTMNLAALLTAQTELLSDSGEGKVFLLNLFLLYGALHGIIQPQFMVITKSKLQYWVQRVLS
jgi:hypothetical protein